MLASDWWRQGRSSRAQEDSRRHLDHTMDWLRVAHDRQSGRGLSAGYSVFHGWLAAYPETTGYAIPTFFDYAQLAGKPEFRSRAVQMANWEIDVQLPTGAVLSGLHPPAGGKNEPAVFNTGQVILGWCRAFDETQDARYLQAAHRAGDWLVQVQSPDGTWSIPDPETATQVHAYDVRTAWSLLELHRRTQEPALVVAARKNLMWTLAQQNERGWFANNAFFVPPHKWHTPFTHTIAYVMEGLLESSRLLNDASYLEAARRTADQLLRIFEVRRFMPGDFDDVWKSGARYSCLTGDAQIAGVWLQLFERTQDVRYLNAALKLNDYVKGTQLLRSLHSGIRGGVKGSQPIFGRYTRFAYLNWAAKFLADSLMLEIRLLASFEQEVRSRLRESDPQRGR